MKTMTSEKRGRRDVHRDSQFVPADYRYVFSYALPGGAWSPGFNFALLRASMTGQPVREALFATRNGFPVVVDYREVAPIQELVGTFFSQDPGQCDVCGTHYSYGDVWQHRATGETITIGHECADKYGALVDRSALDAYRREQALVRKMGRERVDRLRNLRRFVAEASPELRLALRADHDVVRDIRSKLVKWGSLSPKQAAFVLKLAQEVKDRAARQAARDAEPKGEVVEGRQEVVGEVVSVKTQDGFTYNSVRVVMTVRLEDSEGRVTRLWGTCPESLLDVVEAASQGTGALKGRRVGFTATVTRSDRDPAFGFFKRPNKAVVL